MHAIEIHEFKTDITSQQKFIPEAAHLHFQGSCQCRRKFIIATESVPIIGTIVRKVAQFVIFIYHIFFPEKPESSENMFFPKNSDPIAKMWKNTYKAIQEHREADNDNGAYATIEEAFPSLSSLKTPIPHEPLTYSYHFAEAQGIRPTMEDAHFQIEIEQGILAGVFDGHGGDAVAKYANTAFSERFSQKLHQTNGNVREAFTILLNEIHDEIAQRKEWGYIGSTAVISFIDKTTRLIYTATLGDSEANIYRVIDGKMKSIPLSCVRDWSSEKDAARAAEALNSPDIAIKWPQEKKNDEKIRFPHPDYGINVSRALGDVKLSSWNERPGVIHKPKITVNIVQPGDILILACDGLKDYVPEQSIIGNIETSLKTGRNISNALVESAINDFDSGDNVTVISIQFYTAQYNPCSNSD